ncbi:MAG: TGS domain-containing protein, partial [Shimia sp.]
MSQITVTLPDGNQRSYEAGITPGAIAADISTSLGKKAISATVDGQHWDLAWPLQADAALAINTMKERVQAEELVRHDLAHV